MKANTWILSLSAAGIWLAASLETRQLPPGLSSLPQQKAVKVSQALPKIPRPGSKRIILKYGPYKLKAANSTVPLGNGPSMDPAGTGWTYLAGSDVPRDITVLFAASKLVFEDNTDAGIDHGIYNHHVAFSDLNKAPTSIVSCGRSIIGSEDLAVSTFVNGANEKDNGALYTTLDGKFNSGYYIGKNHGILLTGDVINYKNWTQDVYTLTELEYVEGSIPGMMEVSIQALSIGQCEGASGLIEPPVGKTKFKIEGKDMTVTKNGYWMTSKGHMHDGGVNFVMKLNGKEVCNSHALYTAEGVWNADTQNAWRTIDRMEDCPMAIKVVKGDKLSLSANYDLDTYPARKQQGGTMAEGMALFVGFFALANDP